MKTWYKKWIAMILAIILSVSNIAPVSVWAKSNIVTQVETENTQAKTTQKNMQATSATNPVFVGNTGYATLQEAITAAANGATITLRGDVTITSVITINKNLTIVSDGGNHTIQRGENYQGKFFEVVSGVTFTIGKEEDADKVILDGGANWVKGEEESGVLTKESSEEKKQRNLVAADSPVEKDAYNNGLTANETLIWVTNGTLKINKSAVLQNNDHTNGSGAAIATSSGGSSKVHIYGTVKNNAAKNNGGAISSNGYVNVYDGAVFSGNKAGGNGGAIENYSGGVMTFTGGTFQNNAAENGGAIATDGKLELQGGRFSNNTAASKGGAVCVLSTNDGRSALFYAGSLSNNTATLGSDVYMNTMNAKYKGNINIGNVYLNNGQYLKVTGGLTGNIGVSYAADPGDTGIVAAKGDGYTLTKNDTNHITSVNSLYAIRYKDNNAYIIYQPVQITAQPQNVSSVEINTDATLSVNATSVADTEVSYQWYECNDADGNDAKKIEGATNATYQADTSEVGLFYYYCVVSAPQATETKSNVVSVKVIDSASAEIPQITAQPEDGTYDLHKEATLTIEAAVEDGGVISYQWYRLSNPEQEEGEAISGATDKTYTVDTSESGSFSYYCVVTNTNEKLTNKTATKKSRVATVTVTEAAVTYNNVSYSSLDDALVQIDGTQDGTLTILKDVTVSRSVTITGGDLTVTAPEGTNPVMKLTTAHTGEAFIVKSGSLTLENVTLDGGAIWSGSDHFVMKRGTNNRGRSVNAPLITMSGGTVNLNEGTILQNNVANWTSSCVVMTAGTLNINGAYLQDCYGGSHGGVIYSSSSNSTINMTCGKIIRNQARSSTGGLCADTGTKLTISGGEIAYNYTVGRAGGVFINGTLDISGDTDIHDNYAGGNGGGILHLTGNLTMHGGKIRNNTALSNGGGIASLGGILTLEEGKISGNTASVQGNGIYVESGVTVTDNQVPAGVTDAVYSPRTITLTLDGNGSDTQSKTVHYLGVYDLPEAQRNGYQFLGWFTDPVEGEQVHSGDRITTTQDVTLYAHWLLTATNVITINKQPEGGTYYIEDASKLKVEATAVQGNLIYQWYQCEDENKTNPVTVGEDSAEFSLPTQENDIGTYYYYCVISAENRDAEDVTTEVISVNLISKNYASTPVFTTEPEDAELFVGDTQELSAEATVNDNGTITYQWYKSASDTFEEAQAQAIEDADEAQYTVQPDEAGTTYYFVKAINTKTNKQNEKVTAETVSRGAKVISHNKIAVKSLSSSDSLLSSDYWKTYRVGTETNEEDGYITEAKSFYGNYSNGSAEIYAFDGKSNTFWETARGSVKNQMTMTFNKAVQLDRIVYSTRQDGYAGRGYPTTMTIYSKNANGVYEEVGVAKSQESGSYVLFTLPTTITSYGVKMEFTQSTFTNWATAAEIVLLRAENTVMTGSVSITGNAIPGETLMANPITTVGPSANLIQPFETDTLSYQWQRSEDGKEYENISGATQQSYTIAEGDANKYLRVVVRSANEEYSGSLVSEPYKGLFEAHLEGNPVIGETIQPKISYMTGNSVNYSYQWQRSTEDGNYEDIAGANNSSYTITADDAGKKIRVAVTVSVNEKSYTVDSDSADIQVSAILTGAPQVGNTLEASLSGVKKDADVAMTYQWQVSESKEGTFSNLESSTEQKYTIPSHLEGKYIRAIVTVTRTKNSYTTEAWEVLGEGSVQNCEGDFMYLSDIDKKKILTGTVGFGDLEYDRNTSKNRISLLVDGVKNYFMKGFGAHANATLIFDVSDYIKYYHYDRFIAYLGLDNAQGNNGNGVTFTVSTSQDGQRYETVKTTGVLKGNTNAVPVDIDLNGAKYLKIYIDTNGNASSDHAVVADAKLATKDYVDQSQTTALFKTVAEYDEEIKKYEADHSGKSYTELLHDRDYQMLIYQRSFVKGADYQLLKAYLYDEDYVKTFDWFFNDYEALELYTGGGTPAGSYANFIEVLKNLYIAHGEDMQDETNGSLYKKMIITTALTHSTSVTYWADSSVKSDAVRRYEIYRKLYDNKLLLNDVFKNLTVEEMRWVINNISADEEIEWLNYYVRYHTNKKDLAENGKLTLDNFTPGPYYFITYTMGFNYNQPRFYSAENKESWQKKYFLTNETADPKVEPYDFNITYANNHPRLWIVWEAGAVCGGIAKTGTNLLTAFGVPGVVIGQPGHAAYFQYFETSNGKGKWEIYNDVSGWTLSEKGERMLNGWGNSNWDSAYQGSYVLLAQAALNEEQNYFTSQELVKLADVYSGNPEKQIEIYEEALKVLDLNMDAWVGMINAYKAAENKAEKEMLELAGRISEALTYYPLPMRDILTNLIEPNINSEVGKAEVSMDVQTALRKAAAATTNDTLQPNHCKTMANYLLGKTDPVATFSFDGDKAGTVVLNDSFSGGNELLISIDSGSSWINAGTTTKYQFTTEQLEKINADDDIRVKLQGTNNYYTIDITKGATPTNLYNNDLENRITGNVSGLEWKEAEGDSWEDLTSETIFAGEKTIVVRRKATGTKAASDSIEFSFTEDTKNPSRNYIPLRHINYIGCSSAETGKGEAATNILDGNIYTIWHTAWNGSDGQRYLTVQFDEPRYLTSIDYTPRQGAGNGTFQNVEIYTSMDGDSWVLSGTVSGWANDTKKKTVDLFAPVYTSYVKVKVTKGVGNFASGAMLEFFEDTTVEDKTVERIELRSAPSKTTYMLGDELNTSGLSVMAYYDDGTYSTMNHELLSFTPNIFRETGTQTVQVAYRLDDKVTPITFDVEVGENTRTADSIEIVELPDKTRYFVGDSLDLTGLAVKAHYTDGSTGYLFEDQLTVSPEVLTQDGADIPVTVSYVQGSTVLTDEFQVEVTKQVKAIEVSQKPQKDAYNLGEAFDDTGLEMTLVYTDNTKEVIGSGEYTIASDGFSDTSGTKAVEISYNRKPEIKTSVEVLVYPYITSGYLQMESEEGVSTAYVSGTTETGLPEDGKIVIPSQVTVEDKLNFTVTKIAAEAFLGKTEITSVQVPNTVTAIGSGAFTGCTNLKEIYLTDYTSFENLTVADDAFSDLEGITIYVANEEMAKELADKNLTGLKKFTIVPMTEKMTEIQVTAPEKTEYHLGEKLDLSGLTVQGILENGESITLSDHLYTLSAFDSSKAGGQTITVSVTGTELQDTFAVTVTPAEPVIELQPENATYDTTEFPAPLQVQASISDAGHLQYQWYVSDTEDGTFEKLSSETGTSCAVTPNENKYYYVEVSNNDADGAEKTAVKVQSNVVKIEFGSYEARIKGTAYATVEDAITEATSGATIQLIKNVLVDSTITINKNLTLTGYGLYRKTGYTGKLVEITAGTVIFKDLIVDGGAVWSGNVNSILNRGTSNSGTNTVTEQNAIEAKETLVLITSGELQLAEGTSLQNNCNSSGNYGNSGGAVRISGGKLRINGGQIVNNYCNPYGGAVLSLNSSSVILEKGRIAGNQAAKSGGAFCMDNNSIFTIKDSGDLNMPSIIEDNHSQDVGGAIWLSNGTATLEGGILRNNRANSNGGVVYMSGSGTVELGSATISGNQAGARGNGIHANNGTLNITGVPNMSDQIYLPANKMVNVKADLSAIEQKIPVGVASYNSAGAQFGTADSKELAQKAANAFTVTGGNLPVYAYNGGLYYGNPTTVTLTKDLPQQATVMAGKQLTLSVEASIDPADAGELVYKWYRCSDAEGNGATLVTTSQSDQPNVLALGDCSEGVCYFYCEVSASNGKADTVRSSICTVTVTKFVPASKAIEKMNQLS